MSLTFADAVVNTITPIQRRMLAVLDDEPRTADELAELAKLEPLTARNGLCWLTGKHLAVTVHGERGEPLRWRLP